MAGAGCPIFPTHEVDTEDEADMSPPTSPKDTQQMWSAAPELFHDYLNVLPSAPPEIIQYPHIAEDDEREFINSQDFLLVSQNQTADNFQVSSKNSASDLFQVMKIVSDRQDLSFVEKVHIPEEQIVHLCNRIAPNAAENRSSEITIDFNSLNWLSLPTMGFYGDKGTMGGILNKMGVVDESIHTQMEEETFEAGLYVGLLKQFIVVFYWHQGTHFNDASRKEVSCNLIRYVVDLCDDIYVCVEKHNLLEALAANNVATTSHRPRRNQRLKISHTQNSKNDVSVSSGFRVNIERYNISAPPPEGLAIVPKQTFFFAEGYHRCAFITATYKQSGKQVNRSHKRVGVNELGSELEQLSKEYDLDFTKLSHDDFFSLLQHSAWPDSKRYTDLENSIKARREENRKYKNVKCVQERMEFEKAAAYRLDQEEQFKKERECFSTETKEKLSQTRVLERRMYIEQCRIENANFWNKEPEAHLVFSSEGVNPSIRWMIVELTPNKKDLEDLTSNSMHCVTPSCPNTFEIVCCEPDVEDLKKVAFLRSGELLIFLHDKEQNALNLYLSPKPGSILHGSNAIHKFRRGFDLVAFEESTGFLALYDAQVFKVLIYRFDETSRHIYSTGIEIMLDLFSGSPKIMWMQCIPGRNELLLIDDTNRVRVVELHHHPLMKPKHITLSSHFFNACISGDGSFLFVFQTSVKFPDQKEESTSAPKSTPTSDFELKVYILGDSMSFLKDIFLDININDVRSDNFQVKLVCYGGQIHLVVYSSVMPHHISSNILQIASATEVLEFQKLTKHKSNSKIEYKDAMDHDSRKTCATLDYIYHIFDKFAVDPVLCRESTRDLRFHVLVKSRHTPEEDSRIRKCEEYLKLLIKRLEKEKGKDFSNLQIQLQVHMYESWHSVNGADLFPSHPKKPLGNWIRQLVCLVPIQIAGAENNRLQPLLDGLQMPPHLTYADSISLANLLRFGLYEAVLRQWDGNIKVVSSMGKQSSGKSYLLNHLSGSLLDVSGGRCTNGAWMTIRMDSKCLYVLMDFEGLGSFERTEQEDMLLSVLNAALSNLTIFNKKDFHLDKDTEAIFQRFQSGVSLVKNDGKLFKGLFYIAIKDVDVSDVEDLKKEFREKLLQICKRSGENFLTKMYGGMVEISAMPPFTRQEYYQESLSEIASIIEDEQEELEHTYESGRAFLRDLKLVIAQIAAQDWTPIGSKRVAMKLDVLHRNMDSAVKEGSLSIPGANKMLIDFDTQDLIGDAPIKLGDLFIDLQDTGLELAALNESISNDEIIDRLRLKLESFLERRSKNADLWHSKFQDFLGALVDRRCNRVQKWIHCNTAEFDESDEVHMLQLEADLALAKLKQGLFVCGCKCSICFWRCVQERNHYSDHNCMGNHVCVEKCTYCSVGLDQGVEVEQCRNFAGHGGNHDCKRKNHSCRGLCSLLDKSSNCNQSCCLEIGHEGPHKCISLQHICKEKCSLPTCKNTCVQPIELRDHEKHACHERYCPKTCIMEDCPRSCGYEDHFHELSSDEHLCGNEHVCRNKCEADGICEIFTQLVRQKRLFQGRRGSFEYEHVSEQNGLRKDCCIPIPAFKRCHDGVHIHTLNPDAVHYCEVRCQACGYFCDRPIGHSGLHHTVHGNMRHTNFASDQEEIDIQGRKYTWGESGVAEMCNMHCKGQGRGHIHLIHCPMNGKCTSHIYDNGSRHETRKYGPDMNVPKDELTHETYWKQMRFEDPCTEEEDRKEFGLCNHLCRSEAHNKNDGSSSRSYCTEKLWHAPVENTSSIPPSAGHITADGHVFFCNHPENMPHHVVFVIDRSSSMSKSDIKPITTKFKDPHDCRLGCVYEGIVRFIATRRRTASDDSLSVVLFADTAILALEMQEMKEDLVDNLLQYGTQKGSRFSSGLEQAREVINYGSTHPYAANQKPTVIFFSDGDNTDGDDPVHYVRSLKEREPMMTLHTIMFGKNPAVAVLKEMAEIGSGSFQHSLDEIQLARSFEKIATSLKPGHIEALIPSRISTSTV